MLGEKNRQTPFDWVGRLNAPVASRHAHGTARTLAAVPFAESTQSTWPALCVYAPRAQDGGPATLHRHRRRVERVHAVAAFAHAPTVFGVVDRLERDGHVPPVPDVRHERGRRRRHWLGARNTSLLYSCSRRGQMSISPTSRDVVIATYVSVTIMLLKLKGRKSQRAVSHRPRQPRSTAALPPTGRHLGGRTSPMEPAPLPLAIRRLHLEREDVRFPALRLRAHRTSAAGCSGTSI